MTVTLTRSWNETLRDQLDFHYRYLVRPRLEGLTDEEYLWEPAPGSWSIRPRHEATSSHAAGAGELVMDYAWPEPEPAPLTTIAWRIAHVVVGCFAPSPYSQRESDGDDRVRRAPSPRRGERSPPPGAEPGSDPRADTRGWLR